MDNILTIAIPTYNRANRFDKSMNVLLSQIIKSGKRQYLSVFVSNNGSTDATAKIIDKHKDIFRKHGISFFSHTFCENNGFDANVLCCYRKANSEYVWFLSDDDNIIDNAINLIIDDIHKYTPNVLYFNFDQPPYNLDNPYNKTTTLFNYVEGKSIESISKIIAWPKLTSLVIKINGGRSGEKVKNLDHNFMHVALALQTSLDYGMVLHSEKFIARPDKDYMDHIDFTPYVVNKLDKTVRFVLLQNNRADIYGHIKIDKVDPLTSSMDTLGCYYRGKFVLTPELKCELYSTVIHELNVMKLSKVNVVALSLSTIKFVISWLYNLAYFIFIRKRADKLRTTKSSN